MSPSDIRIVPGASSAPLLAPSSSAASAPASASDARASQARDYIVFGDVARLDLLPAPQAGVRLHGTSPTGESWTTARMVAAEVRALEERGFRMVEDRAIEAPPLMLSTVIGPDNALAREVHQARALNALGPEFEGEGGLFISIDTGVALHRDLPPALHFDDVFTEAPEDQQRDPGKHGTHTTGSAIARGNLEDGGTRGMAPRASMAAARVFDDQNHGSVSSVLRGIERAVEWARQHDGFVVVNMSLGDTAGDPATDPMVQAVERATAEHGILFTISAGNRGPRLGSIGTPGISPSAVTVGAMDHRGTADTSDDRVAWFSSRDREGGSKPTLVARGVNVRSTVPGNRYENMDGTSMAAPITGGGALALGQGLLAMYRRGELRVDPRELVKSGEFQRILAETAFDNPNVPANVEGAGDLRLMAAYAAFVQRYGTRNTAGPAPYYPGPKPVLPPADYALPF